MSSDLPPRAGRPLPPPPLPAARPLPPGRPLPPRPSPSAAPLASVTPIPARPGAPAAKPHVPRSRPDPTGLRVALGFSGIAAASALATVFLAPATSAAPTTTTVAVVDPVVPVQHVTRYVQLLPGQTAPPQAVVSQAPAPTPRIVTITTRQSGTKP